MTKKLLNELRTTPTGGAMARIMGDAAGEIERLVGIIDRARPLVEVIDSMNDEGAEFTDEDEQLLADIKEVLKEYNRG